MAAIAILGVIWPLVFLLGVLAVCDVLQSASVPHSESVWESGARAVSEEVRDIYEHTKDSPEEQTIDLSSKTNGREAESLAARQRLSTVNETDRGRCICERLFDCLIRFDHFIKNEDKANPESRLVKPPDRGDVGSTVQHEPHSIFPD